MDTKAYTFRTAEPKYVNRALFSIVFGLMFNFVLVVVGEVFLPVSAERYTLLALYFIMGLATVCFIYYVVRAIISAIKGEKTVSLTQQGLSSKLFGTIRFAEIETYRVEKASWLNMANPVPRLCIELKNGQLIRYDLLVREHEKGEREIEEYFEFMTSFINYLADLAETGQLSKFSYDTLAAQKQVEEQRKSPPVFLYVSLVLASCAVTLITMLTRL